MSDRARERRYAAWWMAGGNAAVRLSPSRRCTCMAGGGRVLSQSPWPKPPLAVAADAASELLWVRWVRWVRWLRGDQLSSKGRLQGAFELCRCVLSSLTRSEGLNSEPDCERSE